MLLLVRSLPLYRQNCPKEFFLFHIYQYTIFPYKIQFLFLLPAATFSCIIFFRMVYFRGHTF